MATTNLLWYDFHYSCYRIYRKQFPSIFFTFKDDVLAKSNIDANKNGFPQNLSRINFSGFTKIYDVKNWLRCLFFSFFPSPLYCQSSLSRNYSYRSSNSSCNKRILIITITAHRAFLVVLLLLLINITLSIDMKYFTLS